jgi:5'(3')-deoxyribonucleotidase
MNNDYDRILLDLDNTVNELQQYTMERVIELGYTIKSDYDNRYDVRTNIIVPEDAIVKNPIKYLWATSNFWENIPLINNCFDVIKYLYNNYDLWVATVPYYSCKSNDQVKTKWVKKYLPFIDTNKIIFEKEKWNIPGKILIDDKPENLELWKGIKIKFYHGYNKNIETDFTIRNWNNDFNKLKEFIKQCY